MDGAPIRIMEVRPWQQQREGQGCGEDHSSDVGSMASSYGNDLKWLRTLHLASTQINHCSHQFLVRKYHALWNSDG